MFKISLDFFIVGRNRSGVNRTVLLEISIVVEKEVFAIRAVVFSKAEFRRRVASLECCFFLCNDNLLTRTFKII